VSHFSRIRTRFRNRNALLECLAEMGLSVEEETTIRGYRGLLNVDVAARSADGSEIGFLINGDGSFDLVADWWTKKGSGKGRIVRKLEEMAGRIQQEYTRRIVLEQARNDGFSVVEETGEKDGSIRIVVRRWVP
jgi:hypothetical protein